MRKKMHNKRTRKGVAQLSRVLLPAMAPLSVIIIQMLSCCQKKECALTLLLMEYYALSNGTSQEGQLQCALDKFPWTTAMKIAQVCCALLKPWQSELRNTPVSPFCISVFFSQTLLFLLCYFGHQNMLFVSIPISSLQIIFLSEKRICPLSCRS